MPQHVIALEAMNGKDEILKSFWLFAPLWLRIVSSYSHHTYLDHSKCPYHVEKHAGRFTDIKLCPHQSGGTPHRIAELLSLQSLLQLHQLHKGPAQRASPPAQPKLRGKAL